MGFKRSWVQIPPAREVFEYFGQIRCPYAALKPTVSARFKHRRVPKFVQDRATSSVSPSPGKSSLTSLHAAGWSWGYCSAVNQDGWRWIVDAHREGRRYIVRSDELRAHFLSWNRGYYCCCGISRTKVIPGVQQISYTCEGWRNPSGRIKSL